MDAYFAIMLSMSKVNPYIQAAKDRIKNSDPKVIIPAVRKLREWLIANDMTVPDLAMRTGFAEQTFYNYLSGQPVKYPSLAQAFAIEYVTKGFVPAYMWLDSPYIQKRIRSAELAGVNEFERRIKLFVLKYQSLTTNDGMIRHRARFLSRIFGVEWGEVKKRAWADGKVRAKAERADISHLMTADITEEEHLAQDYQDND